MATAAELLIPALIGLVTGGAATAYKSRKDLEVQYDIKLREERIDAYKLLWKELARLAYYAPARANLTVGVVRELAGALRTWYFDTGGLLMSEATREAYFDLQRALGSAGAGAASDDAELSDDTARAVKQLGSRLRTTTTDDVATRLGPLLTHSLRAWLRRGSSPRVTMTRAWSFGPEVVAGWRVRVVNRSSSRLSTVSRVWLVANGGEVDAEPLDASLELPRTLYPREAWQGFVMDREGLMDGVDDPFRSGRASGPGWEVRSRSGSDAPASPVPRDTQRDQPSRQREATE